MEPKQLSEPIETGELIWLKFTLRKKEKKIKMLIQENPKPNNNKSEKNPDWITK